MTAIQKPGTNAPVLPKNNKELEKWPAQDRTLSLVWMDQQESSLYHGDPEKPETQKNITAPSVIKLMNRSAIMVTGANGHKILKATRYIKGCPLILEEEQEQQGFKPNLREDVIWVRKGIINAVEGGSDPGLFNYLMYGYNGNINLDASVGTRPLNSPNELKLIAEDVTATLSLDARKVLNKATNYLLSLSSDTLGNAQYDEDRIEWLCLLFGLPKPQSGYKQEALEALFGLMEQNPQYFLESIADGRSLAEADVAKAFELKIIDITEDNGLIWVKTQKVIKTLTGMVTLEEKREATVDYFLKNTAQYESLRIAIKTHHLQQSGTVK